MDYVEKLGGYMDFSVRQRESITNNISNQVTPGYKAEEVNWNAVLDEKLGLTTTNSGHIPLSQGNENYVVEKDTTTEVNSDGNNVDINKEMVQMFKNNQMFSMSLRALNSYYEANTVARGK